LGGNDYRIREGVGSFQSVGKVNINDSGKEGVGKKSDVCIISRIRGMVRAA
jgi:hypothetical protein